MVAQLKELFKVYSDSWYDLLLLGVIVVSAITIFIGLLKLAVFNRMECRPLRRACLAFSNVALCFLSVAILFIVKNLSFGLYWYSAIAMSVFSIVWYWVYENTCLRDLIGVIGTFTVKKLFGVSAKAIVEEDTEAFKKDLLAAAEEIKSKAKAEIKTAATKVDKELQNL